ncbi:MAG: zf-HC2 domain-containing protein, partial [Planctomycetota bacterium]
MKCEEARFAISDRLDGALDPAVAPRLKEHLSGCEPCRVEDDFFVRLDVAMASSPPPPIPSGLVKSLMRSVQPPRPPTTSKARLALWALGGAAAILVTVLALHAYSVSLQDEPVRPSKPAHAAKSSPRRAPVEAEPAPSPIEDPGAAETDPSPAPGRKRGAIVDATAFEALEALKERVASKPGREEVLDALDRTGLFLEEAAAALESDSPDFGAAR